MADHLPAGEGGEHLGHLVCECKAVAQHENAHGVASCPFHPIIHAPGKEGKAALRP
ncbi:hypothetical protein HMPREF0239_00115 [Clostridium sp. ATCC BAA-442]|nr:hypothetical protein HMPREF0239_00115 [Clostridium sp. ATCC BAA-442]